MGGGSIRSPRKPRLREVFAFTGSAVALALAAPAHAQAVDSAQVSAQIDAPITLIDGNDMDFGTIAPRGSAGTIVMTSAAAAQCTVTGGLVHTGNCRAATFEGAVRFLFLLRVQGPSGDRIDLTGPGGATMALDNFTFGAGPGVWDLGTGGGSRRFLILNADGSYSFYAGGTLHVAANQQPGVYTGTFELQLNYN